VVVIIVSLGVVQFVEFRLYCLLAVLLNIYEWYSAAVV
jgi:hypothetical protein